MSIISRAYVAEIEIRSDGSGRTVHGILVPYGQTARVSDGGPAYEEQFAPGVFARDIAARKGDYRGVKFLYQHDSREPIGRAVDLREDGAGLSARDYGSRYFGNSARAPAWMSLMPSRRTTATASARPRRRSSWSAPRGAWGACSCASSCCAATACARSCAGTMLEPTC